MFYLVTNKHLDMLFSVPFNIKSTVWNSILTNMWTKDKNLKARKNENENIRFGCYIYQDGLDGLKYKDILNIVLECEKLGYDSLWLKDNFSLDFRLSYFIWF